MQSQYDFKLYYTEGLVRFQAGTRYSLSSKAFKLNL